MAENEFSTNLLRAIAAQLHFMAGMQAAREMYGKGYFSLGAGEKATVDHAVLTSIGANYQFLTSEALHSETGKQPMGFQAQGGDPKQES